MKVSELIELLQQCDQTAEVFYEIPMGGLCSVDSGESDSVVKDYYIDHPFHRDLLSIELGSDARKDWTAKDLKFPEKLVKAVVLK